MRHPLDALGLPYRWKLWYPHLWLMSGFGHWDQEHEDKRCPSGERLCPHMHYRLGKLEKEKS